MLRQILGLLLLAGVGIALLAGGIAGAHGWELLALITIGLLFYLGVARLFFSLKGSAASGERTGLLPIVTAAIVGAAATWGLRAGLGINPCVASGLVGIVAALALSENVAAAVYAASFVATSSLTVLPGLPLVLWAGALTGGICCLTSSAYAGVGGKLGTIAAGAVLATMLIFRALGGM